MIENFTLCITTYNRISELKFTLAHLNAINILSGLRCVICDDGSTDETSEFLMKNYPRIELIRHDKNKGLIQSRNELFKLVTTEYAIFIDDDSHFLTPPDFEKICNYFRVKSNCAVLGFRIFWGLNQPNNYESHEEIQRMKSFVGCGHLWRMSAWNEIPDYPEWYKFYGEEDYASFNLFKRNWEIHYFPEILVHHRVDVSSRKKNLDYTARNRRALRAGWSNYLLFYPIKLIPRKLGSSIWGQLRDKVFKGDLKVWFAVIFALYDLIRNNLSLLKNVNRLTNDQYDDYRMIADTKIYWVPKN
ncbi:glycosyltransferase [Flavobacteriaceae bacterium]|nr:glycosyltransferase [Flavobacteriaceae bacterium]